MRRYFVMCKKEKRSKETQTWYYYLKLLGIFENEIFYMLFFDLSRFHRPVKFTSGHVKRCDAKEKLLKMAQTLTTINVSVQPQFQSAFNNMEKMSFVLFCTCLEERKRRNLEFFMAHIRVFFFFAYFNKQIVC
jgi:hypothetical protein